LLYFYMIDNIIVLFTPVWAVSNVLDYDVKTSMISLGNRNFSAPLQCMDHHCVCSLFLTKKTLCSVWLYYCCLFSSVLSGFA
jgi:hypothetical protein